MQYDFWPLVADSTVIVQHVCSVVVFICCFVGIYQERVSPISIVGWGSTCTFICWLFWDAWIGLEEQTRLNSRHTQQQIPQTTQEPTEDISLSNALHLSVTETADNQKFLSPEPGPLSLYDTTETSISTRWQQRLATAKSAILIYSALLGISPILKSLTKSTTSDSIWAVSSWLLLINVFFYDYGGEGNDTTSISAITSAAANSTSTTATNPNPDPPTTGAGTVSGSGSGAKYQSSLSTNAALMASTVLASRLPSTTHVFSITLFSLEVFGLFPVFRRHLRLRSRNLHLTLTIILILAAGAGLGIVLSEHNPNSKPNPNSAQQINKYESTMSFPSWRPALAGALLWGLGNVLAMGACSWWLISLQKYKNVVIGPWDPARPIVRGR